MRHSGYSRSVFIIASIISVSLLNILGVRLLTSVNFSLIAAQMVFIVLFIALSFSQADLSPEALMKPTAGERR